MQRYIIGQAPIPYWCRKQLYQYKRMDGKTGFEFWYEADGMQRQAELLAGDELVRGDDGRISFKRQVQK
jgi:hypothetical protein